MRRAIRTSFDTHRPADGMPQWNKGDEFEAARKKALADVSGR
jgi:hypothetical protein